ncbi:GAF domain-containing protein [Friedmanniella endophytica]|uniref:GAF domain-containing protein n=1 Tax=Microlunatus kandeliicorticis TaxID=1759536 RepID=A0A7W3ITL4_9ACTN|nr:GAF and ANTAR domain-containing protein [Microlunatus kandeliicorticis]MBA8795037.1 GAF domain-containing protein [Microlunatus kandeliicorticis]
MSGQQPTAEASERVVSLVRRYLDDVAARTHRRLGDVAGVAVTMATRGQGPVTAGASTPLAREVDAIQYAIGHGPCLHALGGGGGDYVADLARDDRWGRYGEQAAAAGARSCVSVPVEVEGRVLAVAKVYSGRVDGLDRDQRRVAAELAVEIAGGLALAETLEDTALELDDRASAMDTRRSIDLAIGMLMERVGCDADQAFALLRSYSQTRNVKLRTVAEELTGAGGSPTVPVADDVAPAEAPFAPRGAPPRS